MKKICLLDKQSFIRNNKKLVISTLVTIGIGSVFYHFIENWSWINSIYFSVITLTTVGYGDLYPQTNIGKIFTIFYILTGIGLMLSFINELFNHRVNKKKRS